MKLMRIALYRIEKGERVDNTAEVHIDVTDIRIEGENYVITNYDVFSKKYEIFTVPVKNYEIVINCFI